MTDNRHPDLVAPETTPKPQLGNGFLLAGAIVAPCALLFVAVTPLQPWLHDVLLFGPGLILIVGVLLKVDERNTATMQRHVQEVARQVEETVAPITAIAAQVEHNTWAIKQLTAARTVDLHNIHAAEERMEGLVRSLTGEAIEDLRKEIRAQGEMLERRAGAVGAQYTALTDQLGALGRGMVELEGRMQDAIATARKQAYADGLVDGASGVAAVRRIHPQA